jgi:hypothetical protein
MGNDKQFSHHFILLLEEVCPVKDMIILSKIREDFPLKLWNSIRFSVYKGNFSPYAQQNEPFSHLFKTIRGIFPLILAVFRAFS